MEMPAKINLPTWAWLDNADFHEARATASIGEPYAKGRADRTPPCGIMYLRSSGDGTFENAQAVTAQEIQSVNR